MKVSVPVKASRNLEKEIFMQNSAINHIVGMIFAEREREREREYTLNWVNLVSFLPVSSFRNQENLENLYQGAAMRPFLFVDNYQQKLAQKELSCER